MVGLSWTRASASLIPLWAPSLPSTKFCVCPFSCWIFYFTTNDSSQKIYLLCVVYIYIYIHNTKRVFFYAVLSCILGIFNSCFFSFFFILSFLVPFFVLVVFFSPRTRGVHGPINWTVDFKYRPDWWYRSSFFWNRIGLKRHLRLDRKASLDRTSLNGSISVHPIGLDIFNGPILFGLARKF